MLLKKSVTRDGVEESNYPGDEHGGCGGVRPAGAALKTLNCDERGLREHQGHDEEGDDAHVVLVPVREVGAVDMMIGGVYDTLDEPDENGHSTVDADTGNRN